MTRAEQQLVTKARLMDAAETLFGERGIHRTSLDEVARHAGLTKGAIYANFASKNDLVAAILERKLAGDGGPEPAPGSLTSWLRALGSRYEATIDEPESRRFIQAFAEFWLHGMRDEPSRAVVSEWLRTIRDSHAAQVSARTGELPLPAERFAALMLALDIGVALQHLADPEAVPARLYGDALAALTGSAP
ncbi:TetR/AcrR family transcriptional regulator [Actinoplanes sp. CA-054009]